MLAGASSGWSQFQALFAYALDALGIRCLGAAGGESHTKVQKRPVHKMGSVDASSRQREILIAWLSDEQRDDPSTVVGWASSGPVSCIYLP